MEAAEAPHGRRLGEGDKKKNHKATVTSGGEMRQERESTKR